MKYIKESFIAASLIGLFILLNNKFSKNEDNTKTNKKINKPFINNEVFYMPYIPMICTSTLKNGEIKINEQVSRYEIDKIIEPSLLTFKVSNDPKINEIVKAFTRK